MAQQRKILVLCCTRATGYENPEYTKDGPYIGPVRHFHKVFPDTQEGLDLCDYVLRKADETYGFDGPEPATCTAETDAEGWHGYTCPMCGDTTDSVRFPKE